MLHRYMLHWLGMSHPLVLMLRLGGYTLPEVLDMLMVAFQATFMVFLSIQYTLGKHGGGVHQWNTAFSDVQYNYQVGHPAEDLASLILTRYM